MVTCSRPEQGQESQRSRVGRGSQGPSLTKELLAEGSTWGSVLQFPLHHCDKHHDQTQLRSYLSYPSISQSITNEERVETQAGISETVEQGCWLAYPLDGSANFIIQSRPTSLGMVLVTVDWTVLYRSTNVL